MIRLPKEVVDWIRNVFAIAGRNAASKLAANPNAHEPWIDFSIIETLQKFSTPYRVADGWNVLLDTHWLGGYPMYRRWEIADFGILVMFASGGKLVRSKIGLLQSKRLYSTGTKQESPESIYEYYQHGFGRMFLSDDKIVESLNPKVFSFDDNSAYEALKKDDEQWVAIEKYEEQKEIPVYYLLYNPSELPVDVKLPHVTIAPDLDDLVGCRVVPSKHIRKMMSKASKGDSPTFADLRNKLESPFKRAPHRVGWRLEYFIADLLIQCRTGRITDIRADDGLFAAFYQRSRPIQAAISIVIDAPANYDWPVEENSEPDEGE